jgi:hypothetical protein
MFVSICPCEFGAPPEVVVTFREDVYVPTDTGNGFVLLGPCCFRFLDPVVPLLAFGLAENDDVPGIISFAEAAELEPFAVA